MQLQVAIDRVTVPEAIELIRRVGGNADIVEIGTSLIKEYGLADSVGKICREFPGQAFLADIKTCDEGAYEFQKTYEAGVEIATVMGFSSFSTVRACEQVAQSLGKPYLIDLLECDAARVKRLAAEFPQAIFGIHLPSDCEGEGLTELVEQMAGQLSDEAAAAPKIAAAGGVRLSAVPLLKQFGIEVSIVGGAITKAADVSAAARAFYEAVHM
ncbi:orotidine 5'-phosphate decarboxylase [Selenomonas sp. TAMA-11512]|uniref:orotidine 5'-phosphate decarboxylase / HUMPS family protein n=1 Tax=Selenomonas sp. TAMA-11512 TaxID=3095337 RepID=UPI003084F384|nr:orotidine 5'-phosphate decarboxylase [Selenomonas sp. TAMA-11512]